MDVGCLEYGCGFGDPNVFSRPDRIHLPEGSSSEFFDEAADLWKDFPWVGGSFEDVFAMVSSMWVVEVLMVNCSDMLVLLFIF